MIYEFKSSVLSKGNTIFPTKLVIDTGVKSITVFKRRLIGYDQMALRTSRIVSIEIKAFNELILFSEISINTYSGSIIHINGFTHKEAKDIKGIIEAML